MTAEKLLPQAIDALAETTRLARGLAISQRADMDQLNRNDRIIAGTRRAMESCETFFWYDGRIVQPTA